MVGTLSSSSKCFLSLPVLLSEPFTLLIELTSQDHYIFSYSSVFQGLKFCINADRIVRSQIRLQAN